MGNENNSDDNDHDWIYRASIMNDIRSAVGTGFNKAGGSFRISHNGSFSPKYYKSGWGGGSRGNIKTYKSAKIGGAVSKFATSVGLGFLGYNLYGAYKEDGNQWGNNCKITVCSEAGSWAGARGWAAGGAALGSVCGPAGTVIGGIIGGIAGGIGGGKGGEAIGNKIYGE